MWDDLFFLNEADDDEEKKKNEDEKDDDEKKESKDNSSDEDYNDLMDDDEDFDDSDIDDDLSDDSDDSSDDSDSDYNTLVVVKSDSDTGTVYDKAAKAAYAYIVISNNMKHIHLNVCGRKFREIHEMCDSYYSHFSYMADYFYELAAESPLVTLDNPTRAKEHCEDIEVETEKEYDFKSALERVNNNIELAIKYISELRSSLDMRTDVQSKVDEELGYLNKESRYFIRKRLIEPTSEETIEMESYNYNDLL
jgi:PREDICTED: similar to nucleolin|nr:MAG TPA: DpsA [Caudoviricetes sp.]